MKNSECIIEQYRGDKLVRSFTPTGDQKLPWSMNVNGKSYLRTNGWVLSKVLPTLDEGSPLTTKVVSLADQVSRGAGMQGAYTIVPASAGHVPSLPEIEQSAASLFGHDVPAQLLETGTPEPLLAAAQREGTLWVALGSDGQPVGFARLELAGDRAHLAELDVLPAHGRRGVGTALLQTVEAWALSNGFAELTLTTYREFPWNGPFYARLGYEIVLECDLDDDLRKRFECEAGVESELARRVAMRKRLVTT